MAPPTSYQESSGSSKATKFVQANPFDPMIRPFQDYDTNSTQQEHQNNLANNVNARLENAMAELVVKHHNGTAETDSHNMAPTGSAYQYNLQQQQQYQQQQQTMVSTTTKSYQDQKSNNDNNNADDNDEDDDDSDYDSLLDDDNCNDVLQALRERRIAEMKLEHEQRCENIANGYGQYRTIRQDEFLSECAMVDSTTTSSSSLLSPLATTLTKDKWVVVHFYHDDFQRCLVMDHHLTIICPQHVECKFVRIDAQKAPFFVTKLQVRTLPTVLVFCNGKTINRLIGFDGLKLISSNTTTTTNHQRSVTKDDAVENFETQSLLQWLASTGAIRYKKPQSTSADNNKTTRYRSNASTFNYHNDYDNDDD